MSATTISKSGKARKRLPNHGLQVLGHPQVGHPVEVVDAAGLPDGRHRVDVPLADRVEVGGRDLLRARLVFFVVVSSRPRPDLVGCPVWCPIAGRQRPGQSPSERGQLGGLRHRALAGEALADVGGGAAVDGGAPRISSGRSVPSGPAGEHQVGPEGGERTTAASSPSPSRRRRDQRDLPHRREVEVDRAQQVGERLRVARRRAGASRRKTETACCSYARSPVSAASRSSAERGGRVAGRDRVVVDVLAAGDQLLVVARGGEEAAALGVGEALDHRVGGLAGARRTSARRRSPRTGSAAPRPGRRGPRGRR